jgi:glycosyltransferase involved in cell wall biosynthesis
VITYRAGPRGVGDPGLELADRSWGADVESLGRARLYARRLKELIPATTSLQRAARRCSPDIVHLQAEVVPRVDHLVLARLRRHAGVVVTIHDPESMGGQAQVLPAEVRRWRQADAVIVHSEASRLLVEAHAPGLPVHVVPVDLDLSTTVVSRPEARRRLGLGGGRFALLLGFLRPYKGLDLLAAAWPAVARARPEVRLMLVGEPYPSESLERLCELEGVEMRPGFLPDVEVDFWAAAADVVVMPYDRGSHSGVLNRAVAVGTPVLASPALAEEVERTGAGRVVPLESAAWSDAIASALGPDPLPPPPPLAGGGTAAATIDIYSEVLDRRARPPAGRTR